MGFIERLVRLANELSDDDETQTYTGERSGTGGRINYGISLDSVASGRPQQQRSQPQPRPRQRYLMNARKEDGELIVTIDVPDVPKDDLGVTFNADTNVIEILDGERPIKRLGLEWDDAVVRDASYNNYILELRIGHPHG